jgi:Flp pilus assembly protein TadG
MAPRDPKRRLIRQTRLDGHGVAAVEFALVAPILLAILLSIYDLGNAIQQRSALQQAVRAGGRYAMTYPDRADGIVAAIKQAYPFTWVGANPTVEPSTGNGPPLYLTLSATPSYSTLLLPIPSTAVTYVVRFQ